MLLELAIGDAYGAGFEYANTHIIRQFNTLAGYIKHQRHDIKPGAYTDDTQMSIAIAEAIIADDPWTHEALAARFVTAFKRDPREGYARRFYALLQQIDNGQQLLEQIIPTSDKSGAAMRAAPLGVFATSDEVTQRATIQAQMTHNTPDGINAAVAAALMSHYCLYRLGPKADIGRFLEDHVRGNWNEAWHGEVGAQGWMSVQAAVTALLRNNQMSSLLRDCIAFGGDVDTVATIALAAGSCCAEIVQDLPSHLVEQLENGPFGRNYLLQLDKPLLARVNRDVSNSTQ